MWPRQNCRREKTFEARSGSVSVVVAIVPSPGWFDIQGTLVKILCSAVFAMAFDHFPAHIECVLVLRESLELAREEI